MIITVNGEEEEALPLIMRKEFAQQIIDGTKKFEVRAASLFYDKKFLDMKDVKRYNQWRKKEYPWGNVPWREDLPFAIHFYNYANTFSLDVEVLEWRLVCPIPEEEEAIHEWGCHEFDELIEKFKNMSEEEAAKATCPVFYVALLGEIYDHKGL